ncbi:MAG: glycogen-binding domain-containing protein [Limisphaerales bacterium]
MPPSGARNSSTLNHESRSTKSVGFGAVPCVEEKEIALRYFAPKTREVELAGDFNSRRADAIPLKNADAEELNVQLKLRADQYEYRFVVNQARP